MPIFVVINCSQPLGLCHTKSILATQRPGVYPKRALFNADSLEELSVWQGPWIVQNCCHWCSIEFCAYTPPPPRLRVKLYENHTALWCSNVYEWSDVAFCVAMVYSYRNRIFVWVLHRVWGGGRRCGKSCKGHLIFKKNYYGSSQQILANIM